MGSGTESGATRDRAWACPDGAIGDFVGAMHDDLVDAVEWAVAHDHADPSRIAICGGSCGGYAALVGITVAPNLFAEHLGGRP